MTARRCVALLFALFSCLLAFQASAQTWQLLDGAAKDIGVGKDGSAWVIGTAAVPGGFEIYRRGPSSWPRVAGGAVRIAVEPSGNAWVVNSGQSVFRFDGATFQPVAGITATDIGVGADGTVWVIGSQAVPGGFNILRLTGSTWNVVPGGALRIAVDPSGKAWVVNSTNTIFRHDGANWVQVTGAAKDVGVGADGSVWITRADGGMDRWNGTGWTRKSGGAVQVAVGPDGNAWVVNGGNQIYRTTDSVAAATVTTINLEGAAIPIVTVAGTTSTSSSGTASDAQPALEFSTYVGREPYPANAPVGNPTCPLFENSRLTLGCNFQKASAIFIGNKPACPSGAFVDPQNGGECWTCPAGFIRNASPINSADACWKAISEDLAPATKTGITGCPSGSFADPNGKCYQCPSGFNRTWDPITSGTACSKSWAGPFASAAFMGTPASCASDSFFEAQNGGECWKCPSDYRRTLYPVSASNACAKTLDTQYQKATVKFSCATQAQTFGYGPAFGDPQNGGECWSCPIQYSRGVMAVSSTSACAISEGTVLWNIPQYPDPGVQKFLSGILADAFRDARQIDKFLDKRANGNATLKAQLWNKMATQPNNSPEFKAIIFTALLSAARRTDASMASQSSVMAFQNYVKHRRTFIAKEAGAMYQHWLTVNSASQYSAARASLGGFAGIGANVLGGRPGDYTGIMNSATGPDARGADFLDAFLTLGEISGTTEFKSSSSVTGDAFDPTLVLGIWDGVLRALDMSDFVQLSQAITATQVAGRLAEAGGKVSRVLGPAALGAQLVRQVVELAVAITVLQDQAAGERKINETLADANRDITVKDILAGSDAADRLMLMHFWAMATSPHLPGAKAGEGKLTDASICAVGQPGHDAAGCSSLRDASKVVLAAQAAAG